VDKIASDDNVIRDAYEILNQFNWTDAELLEYEHEIKRIRDNFNVETSIKERAHAEGLAAGKAEGLAAGKAEGLAEGLAEGKAEGKAEGLAEGKAKGREDEKTNMIKNMLINKISIEVISKVSGFSKEKIMKINLNLNI